MSALRARDAGGAIHALLAVWQRTRAPGIADAIERLSSNAGASAEAALAGADDRSAAWAAISRNAIRAISDRCSRGGLRGRRMKWRIGWPCSRASMKTLASRWRSRRCSVTSCRSGESHHGGQAAHAPLTEPASSALYQRCRDHLVWFRDARTLPVLEKAAERAAGRMAETSAPAETPETQAKADSSARLVHVERSESPATPGQAETPEMPSLAETADARTELARSSLPPQ